VDWDLAIFAIGLFLVNAAIAWLYAWSYRALCRGRANFALKSLLPTLWPDVPLLCFAGVSVVSRLRYPLRRAQDDAIMVILCIAVVCAMFSTVIAWMHKRRNSYLAALASAGIALGVIGLVVTTAGVVHGFGEVGPEIGILFVTAIFSFPSFWMAVAFLRCLKIESAARNAT
jgi:hypothetical protein